MADKHISYVSSETGSVDVPLLAKDLTGNGKDYALAIVGNIDTGAVVTLSAASANGTSADQVNYNGRGLHLVIDITALAGTSPTLTVTIQAKDPTSGKYYTLLASASLNATGTTVLQIYPGLTASANLIANAVLPRTWRVSYVIGGTTPAVTATIAASVIV